VGSKGLVSRIWRDLRGASVIEYALLIGLIILMVLGLIIAVGKWTNGLWANFAL
jgi:Flp pilus assembly pilin Flp